MWGSLEISEILAHITEIASNDKDETLNYIDEVARFIPSRSFTWKFDWILYIYITFIIFHI